MTRRSLLRLAGGASLSGFPAVAQARPVRPNILFLLTDDQRHDALSCAGNPVLRTPNMDRIAAEGVRFRQAFVTNSLCSPSRGTLLTGLYSHAHGVMTNGGKSHYFREGILTFPLLLRQAGYYTALAGKWHIASPPAGFDHWIVLPGQGVYHDPVMVVNTGRVRLRGYVDDLIADQALEMLRNRPKDRPFCLLCQFKAPHRSWEPPARLAKAFDDVGIPEPATFRLPLDDRPAAIRNSDIQLADLPDFEAQGVSRSLPREQRARLNFQRFLRNYYRVLTAVDENVGRLLDYLDKEGLAENTLVIYTSDNGFFAGEYGLFDKRMMYEPSIRVPMLARYPAAVRAGRLDSEHMVLNNDVAHTILDFAGVPRPAAVRGHGLSWRPLLQESAAAWRDAWMYQYFEYPAITCTGKMRGIRTSRWKLIHYIQEPQDFELFDLDADPEERNNLFASPAHQTTRRELRKRLQRIRSELGDDFSADGTPTQPCTARIAGPPGR